MSKTQLASFLLAANFLFGNCVLQPTIAASESSDKSVVDRPGVRKRALLIGVSNYTKGGWGDLGSAADIQVLKKVLSSDSYGFSPDRDIVTLTSAEETTKDAITKAWEQFVNDTREGDVIWIHHSCHGSQVPDEKNGDEKADGYDETLVPSDAERASADPEGKTQIRDDAVRDFIKKLLAKKPTLVTMTFDCCHSGSNTRGRNQVRGFDWQGAKPRSMTKQSKSEKNQIAEVEDRNLVALYGARSDQVAQETTVDIDMPGTDDNDAETKATELGLFTYALARALSERGINQNSTYLDLFERIEVLMSEQRCAHAQNAQIEGKTDNVLLSGTALPREPMFTVELNESGVLKLKAGKLQNVTKGSIYELYPPETKKADTSKSIGKYRVSSASGLYSATLEPVDGSIFPDKYKTAKAKEIQHNFGKLQLTVMLDGLEPTFGKNLVETLQAEGGGFFVPFAQTEDTENKKWDLKIAPDTSKRPEQGKLSLVITRGADGTQVGSKVTVETGRKGAVETAALELDSRLRDELNWMHLKRLGNFDSNSEIAVEIRVVPVEVEKDDEGIVREVHDKAIPGNAKTTELTRGDCFQIEVRIPEDTRDAYLNVLDLMANGKVKRSYPGRNSKADEIFRADGQWKRLDPILQINLPDDWTDHNYVECLKVIATPDPVDLSPLVSKTRGDRGNTPDNPIAQLLLAAHNTTRSDEVMRAPEGWATTQIDIVVQNDRSERGMKESEGDHK